jgi:uncharacterized protein YuzE
MANLKIFHDVAGRTLTVWFAPPELEAMCEETGDEIILMKDKDGHVIGFEKLNYIETAQPLAIAFQALQSP